MTTNNHIEKDDNCPAEGLLKMLSGKWKPQIYRMAVSGPVRFNILLRSIKGANKQSITVALRELESADILKRTIVSEKPLHVEYQLTNKGESLVPIFQQLERFAQ